MNLTLERKQQIQAVILLPGRDSDGDQKIPVFQGQKASHNRVSYPAEVIVCIINQ